MTPNEKQKCIAEQAVYGDLHFVNPSGNVRKLDAVSSIVAYNDKGAIFTPILRPLSDLTKEITHKGYNDDKTFIPLVELKTIGKIHNRGLYYEDGSFYGERPTTLARDGFTGTFVHWNIPHQQQLLDLLHQWHFDTRNLIGKGDAIDVNTLDINPYSV